MPSPAEIAAADTEFSDAFAALQSPTGAAPAAAAPADVTDVMPKTEPAPAAAAPAAGDPSPAAAAAPAVVESAPAAAAPASTDTTATADPAPVVDPAIAALQAEIAALKAAQPAPAAAAPSPEPAPAAPPPVYTDAEAATIAKYKEDWPDIQAGEALVRRAEYRELVTYVFAQVRQELAPLQAFTQTQSGRTQYGDLVALVPDYDTVRDKTLEWIAAQPAYLKTAYQSVADNGTPSDVADLINRFKKETGYVAPTQSAPAASAAPAATAPAAAVPAAKPAPAKSAAALPAAAAAAAANLRVVKSGRTEPGTAAADPDDFDAAFAEFSKAN